MKHYFSFTGISVCLSLPVPLRITRESEEFALPNEIKPDLTVEVSAVDTLDLPAQGGIWHEDSLYLESEDEYTVYRLPMRTHPPYARIRWNRAEPGIFRMEYIENRLRDSISTHTLLNDLGLETLLLHRDALMLHASFIRWKGRAILFTAPSGTGKSTQAELWQRHRGAEIINGDRAGLRKMEGTWTAWGLPIAGSSLVFRNESAPVAAVVVLRQAEENRIRPLSALACMPLIYPELSIHRWERTFAEKALNLSLDFLFQVPAYLLECLPDEGAVDTLLNQLIKEGNLHESDACGTPVK